MSLPSARRCVALGGLLLLGFVLALVHGQAAEANAPSKHVLLVAIPLPGHLNPLVAQGVELRRRGWRVTLASPSRMKSHIQAAVLEAASEIVPPGAKPLEPLTYMNLGDCSAVTELTAALERAASEENYMESAREMFQWSLSLHHCMYTSLLEQVSALADKPRIFVVDFASYAGFDVADTLNIPFVVNNPDLLNMLSPEDVSPYDFIPGCMTATSLAYFNNSDTGFGLLPRLIYPPARILMRYLAALTAEKDLHAQQVLANLDPTPLFSRLSGRVVLVNNAFGLEYSRPLPPNVVLVGPMLDKKWRPDVAQARAEYQAELSELDREWLGPEPQAASLPVIWVSMGTIAPLNERQVLQLYTAFELGTRLKQFRVLWKLDPSDHGYLPLSEMPSGKSLKVVTWVSSQLGVLAHPQTQLFISHCGINSVHESVYLEKKLLCIPILADQADMAARVLDAGVGVHLSKSSFTSDQLYDTLLSMLSPSNSTAYASRLHRARAAMQLSGGVERAASYIEYVADHGASALVPVDLTHPWWVRAHLDVLAVYTALALVSFLFWRWVCCKARPGKECVQSRKEMRDASARHLGSRKTGQVHALANKADGASSDKQE